MLFPEVGDFTGMSLPQSVKGGLQRHEMTSVLSPVSSPLSPALSGVAGFAMSWGTSTRASPSLPA